MKDLHFRRAQPYILGYAVAASAIAAAPLPMADLPVLSALQLKLLHTIAGLYRQTLDKKTLLEVAGTLGISMLFRQGLRSLLKVIPGFGSVVSSAYAGATTYALGCALCFYYRGRGSACLPEKSSANFRLVSWKAEVIDYVNWRPFF